MEISTHIEMIILDAYQEGLAPAFPEKISRTGKPDELSDWQRLELFQALRVFECSQTQRNRRIGEYGKMAESLGAAVDEAAIILAFNERAVALNLDEDGEVSKCTQEVHRRIGKAVIDAYTKMDRRAFVDISKMIKALQRGEAVRELKPSTKRTEGRQLAPYNLPIIFPRVLHTVACRRAECLCPSDQNFTTTPIGWEEIKEAIFELQEQMGGERIGIKYDDINRCLKGAQFQGFMHPDRPKKIVWEFTRGARAR